LVPALDGYLARWSDFIVKLHGRGPLSKFAHMGMLRHRLTEALRAGTGDGSGLDLSFLNEDDLRELDRDILVEGRFRSADCPACARQWPREQLEVRKWDNWWTDTSRGGLRWICPGGHTVAVHSTWMDVPPPGWPERPADWKSRGPARRSLPDD
jgi:hypothetical protein